MVRCLHLNIDTMLLRFTGEFKVHHLLLSSLLHIVVISLTFGSITSHHTSLGLYLGNVRLSFSFLLAEVSPLDACV